MLDVFSLLAGSAQGSLSKAISDLSGLSALVTYDRKKDLSLGISMGVGAPEPLDYMFRLRPQGASYAIEEEHLSQAQAHDLSTLYLAAEGTHVEYLDPSTRSHVSPTWDHDPLETSLSQVPKMFKEPEDFRRKLASTTFYHVLNVEPRSPVRLPQPMRPASLPGKDGEDLVSCLFYLREADRDRFEAVEDALRAAFPAFERLDFPPVAAGTLAMTWRDKNLSKPLYMHQLSEGMLRFLWLATLLGSPGLTAVTLLDEPEVSLHPELLSLLAVVSPPLPPSDLVPSAHATVPPAAVVRPSGIARRPIRRRGRRVVRRWRSSVRAGSADPPYDFHAVQRDVARCVHPCRDARLARAAGRSVDFHVLHVDGSRRHCNLDGKARRASCHCRYGACQIRPLPSRAREATVNAHRDAHRDLVDVAAAAHVDCGARAQVGQRTGNRRERLRHRARARSVASALFCRGHEHSAHVGDATVLVGDAPGVRFPPSAPLSSRSAIASVASGSVAWTSGLSSDASASSDGCAHCVPSHAFTSLPQAQTPPAAAPDASAIHPKNVRMTLPLEAPAAPSTECGTHMTRVTIPRKGAPFLDTRDPLRLGARQVARFLARS